MYYTKIIQTSKCNSKIISKDVDKINFYVIPINIIEANKLTKIYMK